MVDDKAKYVDNVVLIKELEQERLLLIAINNLLSDKIDRFQKISSESILDYDKAKELEQERLLLIEITKRLEEKETKLDDFFPNLSHELRTNLVPIQAYLEMLTLEKFGTLNPTQSQKLGIVKNNVSVIIKFVTNILNSLKMELGEFVLLKKNFDLGKIIMEAIETMNSQITKSSTRVIFKNTSVFVPCDKQLLLDVLVSLIQNSLNAITFDNGKIEITLLEDNDSVHVKIKDNGKGISEEHIDKIFDKFYKTERTLTDGGLGLGLYFCKQIISIHDGSITVTSKIGHGTTFCFTLPKT